MRLNTRTLYTMSFTYPCPRKLREIMKMSMIEKEPTHQIENIWKEYHSARISNVCNVLSKEKYQTFLQKAGSAPLFMLPLFRKNGHFKIITQWQKDCFLGTFMEDYKRQGSNAQPYIVFTLFTELLFNKGIVLGRGDIINNSLTKPEAQQLWKALEQSYLHESKYELVHNFNNNTALFNQQLYNQSYGIVR